MQLYVLVPTGCMRGSSSEHTYSLIAMNGLYIARGGDRVAETCKIVAQVWLGGGARRKNVSLSQSIASCYCKLCRISTLG